MPACLAVVRHALPIVPLGTHMPPCPTNLQRAYFHFLIHFCLFLSQMQAFEGTLRWVIMFGIIRMWIVFSPFAPPYCPLPNQFSAHFELKCGHICYWATWPCYINHATCFLEVVICMLISIPVCFHLCFGDLLPWVLFIAKSLTIPELGVPALPTLPLSCRDCAEQHVSFNIVSYGPPNC